MDNQPVIATQGVTKRFGDFVAVNKVDFELRDRETLGIIGPNGAGKTTFINLLSGFYPPEAGRVFYHGQDITDLSPARRVKLGITRTFQLVHVFDNLNVYENLGLSIYRKQTDSPFTFGMFSSSLRRRSIKQKVEEFLEILELDHLRDETVASLPLGSKKRLEIAMAFVSEPEIIIFDEPFSGLGDQEIDEVVAVLKKHTHDKTLLVIEHKVSKLEEFVDRLAVMHEGEIIACGECEATLNDPDVRQCYWKLET
jgi:branched-chain amino acid transport system ATP-binding protein